MRILFFADELPMADRNSADFRLSRVLGLLGAKHVVEFLPLSLQRQAGVIGADQVRRYKSELQVIGVNVLCGGASAALSDGDYDAVVFEWHFPAVALIDTVRQLQPAARVLIDSVDVVFNRLEAKARVTGRAEDLAHAAATRARELALYRRADLVITVTDADAQILHEQVPETPTFTIPNIHPLQDPVSIGPEAANQLLFIGSYARPGGETNIDAMSYFCTEVLPLIAAQAPEVLLRIVGGPKNDEIDALACRHVQVLGFVPETRPFLETSAISIAPLRFGGGMKGKIGEAMSFGLPVVTTSTGIEGFGLTPGRHALVGDTPQAFANHVLALLRDRALLDELRLAGHRFISDRYSDAAVRLRVDDLLGRLAGLPVKRLPMAASLIRRGRQAWHRHVGWRLGAK